MSVSAHSEPAWSILDQMRSCSGHILLPFSVNKSPHTVHPLAGSAVASPVPLWYNKPHQDTAVTPEGGTSHVERYQCKLGPLMPDLKIDEI